MAGALQLRMGLFGDEQLVGDIVRMDRRIDDASPWFRMLARWLEKDLDKQFETEGRHRSGGWKHLKPSYLEEKINAGYGDKGILERDGDLRQSLTTSGGHAIRHISPKSLVFGSTVTYGASHQHGDRSRGLVARPILTLSDAGLRRQIIRSAGLYVTTGRLRSPDEMNTVAGLGGRT